MKEGRPRTRRAASAGLGDLTGPQGMGPCENLCSTTGLGPFRTLSQRLQGLPLPLLVSSAVLWAPDLGWHSPDVVGGGAGRGPGWAGRPLWSSASLPPCLQTPLGLTAMPLSAVPAPSLLDELIQLSRPRPGTAPRLDSTCRSHASARRYLPPEICFLTLSGAS